MNLDNENVFEALISYAKYRINTDIGINNVEDPSKIVRSRYLTNYNLTNTVGSYILFIMLKIIYFIASPMIWDITSIKDVFGFLGDSIFYIVALLLLIITLSKKIIIREKVSAKNILLALCCFLICLAFGTASANAGTAMRHRLNLLQMLIYALFYVKESKNIALSLNSLIKRNPLK